MKAYKYITKVSENGIIKIPYNPILYNEEVEIIIVPKKREVQKGAKAMDFVNKWAGYLKKIKYNDAKYEYLSNKYK